VPVRRLLASGLLWGILSGSGTPLRTADPAPVPLAKLVEGVPCLGDTSQTYTLYLPSGYDPAGRHPALLVFDPRGRSRLAAELFREAAERHGWVILSSSDTRSDGPMEPNVRALNALWPEVHHRYATDPRRIYAAGFSGGGMLAWALARATGEVAGVVAVGARFGPPERGAPLRVTTFGAAGDADFNLLEMRDAHRLLAGWGASERLETFAGPHTWLPSELAALAVDWLELAAMREDRRGPDAALVQRLWEAEADRAGADEAAGRPLAAARRWRQMSRDFAGLVPVAEAAARGERLAGRRAARAAAKAEARAERRERALLGRFAAANARLLAAEEPPILARYLAEVEVAELERRARRSDLAGEAARRQLATLLAYTSTYLVGDALARENPAAAAVLLATALRLAPERPDLRCALARAEARAGSRKAARGSTLAPSPPPTPGVSSPFPQEEPCPPPAEN
jgi:predicted esterase